MADNLEGFMGFREGASLFQRVSTVLKVDVFQMAKAWQRLRLDC